MAKYSYITDKTHNDRKIQVESAKRDGSGKNIENNYAKQNGNYQSLTAGLSNNFDTKLTEKDESAYNFRPTATMGSMELEVGSPCKVKKIVGGSVAFNQLAKELNSTNWEKVGATTQISFSNGECRITKASDTTDNCYIRESGIDIQNNHVLLISADAKLNSVAEGSWFYSAMYDVTGSYVSIQGVTTSYSNFCAIRRTTSGATNTYVNMGVRNTNDNPLDYSIKNIQVFDLTQMFGSTIADYIYSLEQANVGSGVAWFKRYFPKEYYAYNSGELVSIKTQGKKITHFNQWDEEWELGGIDPANGQNTISSESIRGKNYIRCVPNTSYYFKGSGNGIIYWYDKEYNYISYEVGVNQQHISPSNASYFKIAMSSSYGTTYNHDICINFHYDGERDGEYEPYNSETYPCDDIELRGMPQLDENNNLAFDGDEYTADGNVKRKYGIVDLGTLEWSSPTSGLFFSADLASLIKKPADNTATNIVKNLLVSDGKYIITHTNNLPQPSGYYVSVADSGRLYIENNDYSTTESFKTAMSGVYLIYPLETSTDENSAPFTEVQECDNWGTEEWLAPTTDTRPCEVPVGHETDYLPDLKAKLEVAPTTPNENGVYVMEHNASGNTYTLLGAWLSDNGYVKPTSISGYDNTKTQTLKNVEGVLTWVDDE